MSGQLRSLLIILMVCLAAAMGIFVFMKSGGGGEGRPVAAAEVKGAERPAPEAPRVVESISAPSAENIAVAAEAPSAEAVQPAPDQIEQRAQIKRNLKISGRVIDAASGEGIPGAKVDLLDYQNGRIEFHQLPIASETRANLEGEFSVEGELVLAPRVIVRATAEGYETKAAILHWHPTQELHEKIDVALRAGAAIGGRVEDENGHAIVGAHVGALNIDEIEGGARGGPVHVSGDFTVTDEDGRFRLARLAQGLVYQLPVKAEGFISDESEPTKVGTEDVRIVLYREGGTLSGRVLHADGSPAAGAQCFIMRANSSSPGQRVVSSSPVGGVLVIGTDGAFLAEQLRPGNYSIHTSLGELHQRARVTLKRGERREVDLLFPAMKTIRLRAFDKETNEPVAGLRVARSGIDRRDVPESDANYVISGPDGVVEIQRSIPVGGSVTIPFTPPEGYSSSNGGSAMQGAIGVDDETGSRVLEAEVPLSGGSLVRIRVAREGGSPVPEARVDVTVVIHLFNGGSQSGRQLVTQADGWASLTTEPGAVLTVRASTAEGVGEVEAKAPPVGTPLEVTVTLQEWASVSGTVYLDGAPIAEIPVDVVGTNLLIQRSMGAIKTDAEGYYYFSQVPPGMIKITVPSHDLTFPYRIVEDISTSVEPGQYLQRQDMEVVLGGTLDFHVKDEEGTPIAGATVSGQIKHRQHTAQTDISGMASIVGVDAGTDFNGVDISHADYRSERRPSLRYEDFPVEIVLKKPSALNATLLVKDAAGPVEQFVYKAQGPSSHESRDASIRYPGGSAELEGLDIGSYKVTAIGVDESGSIVPARRGTAQFELIEGEESPVVEVHLSQNGAAVRGSVKNRSGEPMADVEINLQPQGYLHPSPELFAPRTPEAKTTKSGPDGAFLFEGVVEAKYFISGKKSGYMASPAFAHVVGNADQEVSLTLQPSYSIFGKAIGPDGEPLVGREVTMGHGIMEVRARIDEAGSYRLEANSPLEREIVLFVPEFNIRDTRPVTPSVDGSDVEVNFDYTSQVRLSGRVIVEGGSPAFNWRGLLFNSKGGPGSSQAHVEYGENQTYSTRIEPGEVTVSFFGMESPTGGRYPLQIERIQLESTPREQQRDFQLRPASGDVVVVFPSDHDFTSGRVVIADPGNHLVHRELFIGEAATSSASFNDQLEGSYNFAFASHDKVWTATTEATIKSGTDNVITLDVKKVRSGTRIADWAGDNSPAIDITPHLVPGAKLALTIVQEEGAGSYTIRRVAVVSAGGTTIAVDEHSGMTGTVDLHNTYRLQLPTEVPEGSYRLRVDGTRTTHDYSIPLRGGIYLER